MFELAIVLGFTLAFVLVFMSFHALLDKISASIRGEDKSVMCDEPISATCEMTCPDRIYGQVDYKGQTYNVCYNCWNSMQNSDFIE